MERIGVVPLRDRIGASDGALHPCSLYQKGYIWEDR